jgi:hypothetical protein
MSSARLQNTKWQSCIDACMKCAEACELCATSDLKEQDVKMMASCAQMNRQCAAVCWTSSAYASILVPSSVNGKSMFKSPT